MMTQASERHATRLYRYPIASADMYYSEVEQRDVCVCDDPVDGLRIWGEIPDVGAVTAVNLCQVFLEYAMTCQTWRDPAQAYHSMQLFGERLGEALAKYLKDNAPLEIVANLGACALECVLESMNAHFTVEQVSSELRFVVAGCPLDETAERTGLRELELAHYGINTLCQSLVYAIDPDLIVHAPLEVGAEHIFAVTTPVHA